MDIHDGDITDELNGVSKWNWAAVGMYEAGGLSARLTYTGRSSFTGTRQYRGDDVYIETSHPADRYGSEHCGPGGMPSCSLWRPAQASPSPTPAMPRS